MWMFVPTIETLHLKGVRYILYKQGINKPTFKKRIWDNVWGNR